MTTVHLGERRLHDYAPLLSREELARLRLLARPLAGLRVLHISAAPFGSAVTETLASLVPLQRDLGIRAEWRLLGGGRRGRWSAIYHGLRGETVTWDDAAERDWHADAADQQPPASADVDVVVVHDPQALALASARSLPAEQRWIWHCHLDTRSATAAVWQSVQRALRPFAAVAFPDEYLVRTDVPGRSWILRPAIDPGARQHRVISRVSAAEIVQRLGIDPGRPVLGQFSPLATAYAPLAALGSYWLAREQVPGLQLVLADDACDAGHIPMAEIGNVRDAARRDTDVHIFTTEEGLGAAEIGALRQHVDVALQLAVPAGFGWSVAACQWKGVPVVAGNNGLLPKQVGHAQVASAGAPEAAALAVSLLRDRERAAAIGEEGHQRVRRDHLIPRLLTDFLQLLSVVAGTEAPVAALV